MSIRLVSAAAAEPLTLAELKAQCRVDTSDEDSVLNACISAARRKAEQHTGRVLITSTWEQALDEFPEAEIRLEVSPVQSISSVKYYDEDGTFQTISSSNYTLDANAFPGGWVLPAFDYEWPSTREQANAVLVEFVAGYGTSLSAQQADLKAWLLLTAAFLFSNREALVVNGRVIEVPDRFVDSLLDPYRILTA